MYVVCKEHVEIAIDEFVDEYEDAPDLVDLTETTFEAWEPPACCQYCSAAPHFLIV